jgi:hypothetical protein
MFKRMTHWLFIIALLTAVPVLVGCEKKEVETQREVEIDVEASSEPEYVVE